MLILTVGCADAKSSPKVEQPRSVVFKRAKSLDRGISISWLEQTWVKQPLDVDGLKNSDLELLKKLGFKSIRLPIAFNYFEAQHTPSERVFATIDKVIKQCHTYGFKLVIDYHYGGLSDTNYLTETPKIIDLWVKLAKRYRYTSPDDLFFELYNDLPK